MGTISKYGREFEFDDGTPDDVVNRRIQNWMEKNAADELKPAAESESERPKYPAKTLSDLITGGKEIPRAQSNKWLALAGTLASGPFAPLAMTPTMQKRLGDPNFYRTLAQGALPVADEATAGVRAMLPGGPDYDTALAEERQGVKDYKQTYGEGEGTALEMLGAVGTLPMGVGAATAAARGIPAVGRLAQLVAKHPWLSSAAIGAGTGATTGFASGENGFGERAENALGTTAIGAALGPLGYAGVRGVQNVGDWLKTDNAVAKFLRNRISTERGIDSANPNFTDDAMTNLRTTMRDQQLHYTDPMLADVLPRTAEQVLQKSGKETGELAKNILKRQYDSELPEVAARAKSQHGRVEDAFDMAWGADTFKADDVALLAQRKANADALFQPAYRLNVRGQRIEDALEDPYVQSAWPEAVKRAAAQRRAPGAVDATGNLRSYNTEFLHDIKVVMDDMIESAMKSADGSGKNKARIIRDSKNRLNDVMKDENAAYKVAMERYGDDSDLVNALRKGREEVFVPGSVDKTGAMDTDAIKKYLTDPAIPQEQKDLFLTGAARALRQNVTANQSKKFSHNWADFINNPEIEQKIGALLDGKTFGAWDLFRNKLKKESSNYKNLISGGLGNSRTAARQEMQKELEGGDLNPGAIVSAFVNPTAPSTWRQSGQMLLDKVGKGNAKANRTAEILGRKGRTGNRESLADIERLLREMDTRTSLYDTLGKAAPTTATYMWPGRER